MDLGASFRKAAVGAVTVSTVVLAAGGAGVQAQSANSQRPNVVMLMTDDTGWNDFGAYSNGGATLGHPTPNIDKMAREGAVFTSW
jgi:Sulfatase